MIRKKLKANFGEACKCLLWHDPIIIGTIILMVFASITVTVIVTTGYFREYLELSHTIVNIFGAGNYWLALFSSSVFSIVVSIAFYISIYKYMDSAYRYENWFKTCVQFSPLYLFGTVLIIPVLTVVITLIFTAFDVLLEINPLKSSNLEKLLKKIS